MNPDNKTQMSLKIKVKQSGGREVISKTNYIDVSRINNIPVNCVNNRMEELMTFMMQLPNDFLIQGFSIIAMQSTSKILVANNKISVNEDIGGQMKFKIDGLDYAYMDENEIRTLNLRKRDIVQIATDENHIQ